MKENDIIKIRNNAGILHCTLKRKLAIWDIARGIGDDKLPSFTRTRWEFHKHNDEFIVTLFDDTEKNLTIYIAFLLPYEDLEIWEATINGTEENENIYETITGR